jgi:nucleoside phosphorylase
MTTTEQATLSRRVVDMDGPAIAHLGHRVGDQVAFCGARIIGERCTDGRPTRSECVELAAQLNGRLR